MGRQAADWQRVDGWTISRIQSINFVLNEFRNILYIQICKFQNINYYYKYIIIIFCFVLNSVIRPARSIYIILRIFVVDYFIVY